LVADDGTFHVSVFSHWISPERFRDSRMILLLGATGYIGQAFARELRRRGDCFIPLSQSAFDYSSFDLLFDYVRKIEPEFVINAAGYAGSPSTAPFEPDRLAALQANTLLPQTVARACMMMNTPWGHVSSGSIYSGAKVYENQQMRVEKDLNRPDLRQRFEAHPEAFFGFTELDEPNFSFRQPPCSFYSGTKALAEEAIRKDGRNYIWRLRLPFNEQDEPSNLLSQLQRSSRLYDGVHSLSHLEDCVRACLELWERRAPFGIYNVTNPGAVTTHQVVDLIQQVLKPPRRFRWGKADGELGSGGPEVPRSNCILDVSKLLKTGVKLRRVTAALEDSLGKWQPAIEVPRKKPALAEPIAV
jgi:dTDP-4-dehydrorhamnose reductase